MKKTAGYSKQLWFALGMAIVLIGVVASVLLRPGGDGNRVVGSSATAVPTSATPVATLTPRSSPTVEEEATVSSTEGPTETPTALPTETPTEVPPTPTEPPQPSSTPTEILPEDHYWLERPISPVAVDYVGRFYPYASRMDGSYPIHHGVEFVNDSGTPVLATAAGTIVVAGDDQTEVYGARDNFYGLLVIEELDRQYDGEPVYVLYGHLSEVSVEVGQKVEVGQRVGLVGMTGVAEGPHLHAEVRYGSNDYGATVNPELWFRPRPGYGTLAGQLLYANGEPVTEEARIVLSRASAPSEAVYTAVSYPREEVNSDPGWNENFAIGDLDEGHWIAQVSHRNRYAQAEFVVEAGKTTWLTLQLPG